MSDNLVAVVGMSCQFPGASNLAEFWQLLRAGKTMIRDFSQEEIDSHPHIDDKDKQEGWIYAGSTLENVSTFDAGFFGYSPREAAMMDPQLRLTLESVWHALEDAGCIPSKYSGDIGVYFSASLSTYLINHLLDNKKIIKDNGGLSFLLQNDKDHVATSLSYRLGLTGPSISVGSGCSSSLAAIHHAYFSLLTYQCDAAIAGGASVLLPQAVGYQYVEGGVYSKDGRCIPFSEKSSGTVGGSGVGTVVLKRLEDAVRDNDRIYSVISGSACTNDGNMKVGYTSPSISGQKKTIAQAIQMAGVSLGQVDYIEAHGTGTLLGDPIEITALKEVMGEKAASESKCYLGSVKANIGHLDAASGVAGFIKTSLSLFHNEVPGQINPFPLNSKLGIEKSRFFISDSNQPLPADKNNIACTNSLGMGGTNVFTVQKAYTKPFVSSNGSSKKENLLFPISAMSKNSLLCYLDMLSFNVRNDSLTLADISYTLINARESFNNRVLIRAASRIELIEKLCSIEEVDIRDYKNGALTLNVSSIEPEISLLVIKAHYGQDSEFTELVDDTILASLHESYPVFLSKLAKDDADFVTKFTAVLIINLYVFGLLNKSGIRIERIVSSGIGDLVGAAIVGNHDLQVTFELVELISESIPFTSRFIEGNALSSWFDGVSFNRKMRSASCWPKIHSQLECAHTGEVQLDWISTLNHDRPRERYIDQLVRHKEKREIITIFSASMVKETVLDTSDFIEELFSKSAASESLLKRSTPLLWEMGGNVCLKSFSCNSGKITTLPGYYFEKNKYGFGGMGKFKYSDVTGSKTINDDMLNLTTSIAESDREFSQIEVREWRSSIKIYITILWANAYGKIFKTLGTLSLEELFFHLKADYSYHASIEHTVELLVEGGYLDVVGNTYRLNRLVEEEEVLEKHKNLVETFSRQEMYIDLVRRLIPFYFSLYQGDLEKGRLAEFFEKSDFSASLESLSEYSESANIQCKRLTSYIVDLYQKKKRPLKILEIGCGHLMLSKHVIDDVDHRYIEEYCLTDISDDFLNSARSKAQDLNLSMIECKRLDINKDPLEQDIQLNNYDIVIGINVFHLALDGVLTMRYLDQLLCDGGSHCQIDLLNVDESHNLVWGIYKDWWGPIRAGSRNHTLYGYEQLVDCLHNKFSFWKVYGDRENLVTSNSILWIASDFESLDTRDSVSTPETNTLLGSSDKVEDWIYCEQWRKENSSISACSYCDEKLVVCVNSINEIEKGLGGLVDGKDVIWLFIDSGKSEKTDAHLLPSEATLGGPIYRCYANDTLSIASVVNELINTHDNVSKFVFSLNVTTPLGGELTPSSFDSEKWGDNLLLPLYDLVSIIADLNDKNTRKLCLVTRELFNVTGEECIQAGHSIAVSFLKSVSVEFPEMELCHLDLPGDCSNISNHLFFHALDSGSAHPIALRGNRLWKREYTQESSLPDIASERFSFREKTIVLIGGLGGIGCSIAKSIANSDPVHIIIIHRNQRLKNVDIAGHTFDHEEFKALLDIRRVAKSLTLHYADITINSEVNQVVQGILASHKSIDYVFHLAGTIDHDGIIIKRDKKSYMSAIANKTTGIHNTVNEFEVLKPKKHILFSSLGSILYKAKFGESAYVMANDYLNAASRFYSSMGVSITCVNWTDWNESGMWVDAQNSFAEKYELTKMKVSTDDTASDCVDQNWMKSIDTSNGITALKYALAIDAPELVVTPQNLNFLLEEQQSFNYKEYGKFIDKLELKRTTNQLHSPVDFLSSELEKSVAEIWLELLGLPLKDKNDSFYKAGGDSLLALRMISRIKERFKIELTLNNFVDTQTFSQLVSLLERIISVTAETNDELEEEWVSRKI